MSQDNPQEEIYQPKTNYEKFHFYLRDLEASNLFLDWNFYFLIASAIGRKIWLTPKYQIFPNIFIVFVAEPGFGKGLPILKVAYILNNLIDQNPGPTHGMKLIDIAPKSVTFEKMTKRIAAAQRFHPLASGIKPDYLHSSVVFIVTELGTLFRDNCSSVNDLVNFLHGGYDCDEEYEDDTIKWGAIKPKNMCINFAACTTPNWVGRKSDSIVLTEGWNSRTIYVYGSEKRQLTTFYSESLEQRHALINLMNYIRKLATLPAGPLDIEESKAAIDFVDDWYKNRSKTILNTSPHLVHYYSRKKLHLIKLSMLMHFSESLDMYLDQASCIKALEMLEKTEKEMHNAFFSAHSNNPLFNLAEKIIRLLEKNNGECSYMEILSKLFHEGNDEQIDGAAKFLLGSGYVVAFDDKNRRMLKLGPKRMN